MSEHVVPVKIYLGVFAILMIGTALTVAIAFVNLGVFNPIVALLIACIKAVFVILFFMHVRYSTRLTWAVVVSGFFWLVILLSLTLGDYLTRAVSSF